MLYESLEVTEPHSVIQIQKRVGSPGPHQGQEVVVYTTDCCGATS